jgi:hypothetical protein
MQLQNRIVLPNKALSRRAKHSSRQYLNTPEVATLVCVAWWNVAEQNISMVCCASTFAWLEVTLFKKGLKDFTRSLKSANTLLGRSNEADLNAVNIGVR